MPIARVLPRCSRSNLLPETKLILAKNRQTAASHYDHSNNTLKLELSADPTLQLATKALINPMSSVHSEISDEDQIWQDLDATTNKNNHNIVYPQKRMPIARVLQRCSRSNLLPETKLILAKNQQTAASHYDYSNNTLKLEFSADPMLQLETIALINPMSSVQSDICNEDQIWQDIDTTTNNNNLNIVQQQNHDHSSMTVDVNESKTKLERSAEPTLQFSSTALIDSVTSTGLEIIKKDKVSQDRSIMAKNHKRHVVQHNYHDHANTIPDNNELNTKRKVKGGVFVTFPIKLHEVLDEVEKDGLQFIVSWQPHGRAFIVHKPTDFIKYVLSKYFQQSKISSFQRQLHRYGFSRLCSGKDKGGYYHEMFLRGKPFLSEHMERTKVKGNNVRGRSNPEMEPDFYTMPPVLSCTVANSKEKVTKDVMNMRN